MKFTLRTYATIALGLALATASISGAEESPATNYEKGQQLLWGDKDRGNDTKGVALITKAAEAGDPEAQAYLSTMYEMGLFVTPNGAESIRWLREAVAQEHPDSMVKMAFVLLQGRGVAHDPEEARRLLELAASMDNTSAMANLGALYGMGDGVPRDDEQSAKWYRKAAELGDGHGQWMLAQMYVRGHGVPLDYGECYYWSSLVDSSEQPRAPSLVSYCRERLEELELQELDVRIAETAISD